MRSELGSLLSLIGTLSSSKATDACHVGKVSHPYRMAQMPQRALGQGGAPRLSMRQIERQLSTSSIKKLSVR